MKMSGGVDGRVYVYCSLLGGLKLINEAQAELNKYFRQSMQPYF